VSILLASLGGAAVAGDGVLFQEQGADNYCHTVFQAARPGDTATPYMTGLLGDTIDFYGPCDESPTSREQMTEQKHQEFFRFGRDYEDG
jgi:hypothetical protein